MDARIFTPRKKIVGVWQYVFFFFGFSPQDAREIASFPLTIFLLWIPAAAYISIHMAHGAMASWSRIFSTPRAPFSRSWWFAGSSPCTQWWYFAFIRTAVCNAFSYQWRHQHWQRAYRWGGELHNFVICFSCYASAPVCTDTFDVSLLAVQKNCWSYFPGCK